MSWFAPVCLVAIILIVLIDGFIAEIPITRRVENVEVRQSDGLMYRLPNNTVPLTYDITLTTSVDAANFTFNGHVRIGILVRQPTQQITLHHRQLIISNVRLWTTDDPPQEVSLAAFTYNQELEFLEIPITVNALTPGSIYSLEINYIGTLREDNYGFYRSSYRNDDGVQIWQAATQFEPIDARHAFPCYDEPQLKAVFTTTINHGSSYTALSNMPVRSITENGDGTTTTRFDPTPLMSTYLNVFIVSDFVSLESSQGRVPHRVFARPNAINQSQLTLEAGVKILDAMERYLGVEYSLPKMDQIALPDFGPGAMENWGLVTYRESRFLYDEAVTDYQTKTSILTVIAHEVSRYDSTRREKIFGHQWFGDLVGPRWWEYIWLNEGFANLFGHIGVDLVYPEWRIMDYFVVSTLQNVFQSDALEESRPMTHYIESPKAVSDVFDNIAYAKSGSVLRMFSHALSEQTFVKGLNKYLIQMAYSDADEEDLFNALQEAVLEDNVILPTNLRNIMLSWTRQKGFPVLTVDRDYSSTTVTIGQHKYLSPAFVDPTTWWIPYNLLTASLPNDTTATHWMPLDTRSQIITVDGLNGSDWLIVNKMQTGYYRVKYDTRNYELIADALSKGDSRFHAVTRAQLLDDAFNFARSEELSYAVFFNLTRYLVNEIDYIPWAAATTAFTYLDRMYAGHANHHVFRDFVRKLTENMYDSIGISDVVSEPHLRKYARSLTVKWACEMGSTHCRADALSKLRSLGASDEFHQNVRPEMYCAALRSAERADFDFVWRRLFSSSDSAYRNMLITALACTTSDDLLSDYLSTCLTATNPHTNVTYRPDELVRVFNAVYLSGPAGLRLAIPFLTTNANLTAMTFGDTNLVTIYKNIAQRIADHSLHAQFSRLTTALGPIISTEVATDANNEIMRNVEWVEKHGPVIEAWLKENHDEHHGNGAATIVLSMVIFLGVTTVSFIRCF